MKKDKDKEKEGKKFNYQTKVVSDLTELMLSPDSFLHCDECQERLGVLHTLRYSLFKKTGTPYYVPCRYCAHLNKRVKRQYKEDMRKKWEELEKDRT